MNKLTLTIFLVGVLAAVATARTSPQIRRPFKFSPGQTYIYEYRGRQWNGLPKLADQYSGLTIDCDVIVQSRPETSGKEVLMKLDDIKVEQLHTQALDNNDIRKLNQGQEVNQRQLALYKDELSKPIRFTYVDGKVLRFVAEPSDPEWSINIKKSILSLFQLDLAPSKIIKSASELAGEQLGAYPQAEQMIGDSNEMPLVYPIYEESFGGICETTYELDSVDNVESRQQEDSVEFNDVLNVTKTVNYKNCLTDPSVSYDRHSFNVNTQTIKGKLFSKQPFVSSPANSQFYPVPEEIKSKYSNAYTSFEHSGDNNVASPVPIERHSYTKYNLTTVPQQQQRTIGSQQQQQESLVIEGVYSESKIKYEAEGDLIISDTQQSLKLITCAPTSELARVAPEAAALAASAAISQPAAEYHTIQCELSAQKLKFYQAVWKYAQLKSAMGTAYGSASATAAGNPLYSHKMALPFALSASWYPIVASGSQSNEQSIERSVDPDTLAKSYETLLISLADDVLAEDVAQSKKAGEKVIRLVNIVAFMPKSKLVEVYDRIVERIQKAKQQQLAARGKQAVVDNEQVSKFKVVRKLYIDSLPLAGSKQAIEMIELLIESNRAKPFEAREMCESVPANLRYPDTEIIDAFVRLIQLPQVRKSRSLFASCSIAVGKMIGQAYAKSKDASYKPTTYEQYNKLPSHLREDEIVKQVVEEADPRRQLPMNWNSPAEQELYERLVLDEQDLIKYVMLFKQMLNKASTYNEKVIFLETLAHMKVPQVLPILEPFVTGRLSLAQCLGNQPLDLSRPIEQSQWYNYYGRERFAQQQQQQQQQRRPQMTGFNSEQQRAANQKDWNSEDSFGAEECNYMRTIAIYAMAHVARWSPSKVQALLMPVFDNTYEPYQIRIAAFTTIMLTPVEEHILERIASQMWREPSKEVASFVVGTIDTMSKMTTPAMAPYKYAAQKAAESMPKQYLDTWKFSWMAGGDHFDKQKQFGSTWVAELIKSNVSSIPRAAYVHAGRFHGSAGQKFDNHFELGFTSKGLESLLKEYIAYSKQQNTDTNIVASIIENLYDAQEDIVKYYYEARDQLKSSLLGEQQLKLASSSIVDGRKQMADNYYFKRQQPIDGVNSHAGKQDRSSSQMFEGAQQRNKRSITVQARRASSHDEQDAQEEPKVTLFSKLFDSTSYHALGKKQLIDLIEQADEYIKMTADELIMGGKLHYVKMIMPSNMWHVVPSALGLPVVVTHRSPIVASIKIDGSQNGQLTSNKLSQYMRQQATGSQIPNVQGQNFATMDGVNITALVHPKIMHSNFRFMFAVEQANNEAYGVQVEKSHQLSMPVELSVAYSLPKQLVSITLEPKTPARVIYTKEAAKTFIGQVALASAKPDQWLGQEHLIRVPSQQSQYKRLSRPEYFVPSLLAGVQNLLNEPKAKQQLAIEELETPYKFEHRFMQTLFGLELYLEGATDDEDVARVMSKPELRKESRGQLQWTSTEQVDDLNQHSKSGPYGELLHAVDSAMSRPSKYLEFYSTLKPDQAHKSPVYRVDFLLDDKEQSVKFNSIYKQHPSAAMYPRRGATVSRLDINSASPAAQQERMWDAIEQSNKLNAINQRQQLVEVY